MTVDRGSLVGVAPAVDADGATCAVTVRRSNATCSDSTGTPACSCKDVDARKDPIEVERGVNGT